MKLAKQTTSTRAGVLDNFLTEIGAILINRLSNKGTNTEIDIMVANGKTFMVQTFWRHNFEELTGWDIYIPATEANDVIKTREALSKYLES